MLELFVAGTEQNSSKIFVTAGLAATMQSLGYSTGVYKPVETGAIEKNGFMQSPDLAFVKFADPYIKTYFSYLLKGKTNPLLAAAAENIVIERDEILKDFQNLQDVNECTIVDGSSGLGTPLGKNFLEENLIKSLDLPVLLVVSGVNTAINNVLVGINHAKELGIRFRGVIINEYPDNTDDMNIKLLPRLIEEYTDIKILGVLPFFDRNVNPNDLITEVLNGADIEGIFEVQIAKLQM